MLTPSTVGHAVIPRETACCEITVNLPAFPVRTSSTADYSKNVFVVDDLTKHPTLHSRPYVTGYPHGRSYVGVPITTPDGINIGAYCILDDKPRQGISQTDLVFMRDMSRTIMSHLDTVRALSDRTQRSQLVSGLGSFVRNTADSKPRWGNLDTPPVEVEDGVVNSVTIHHSLPNALIDPISKTKSQTTKSGYFDHEAVSRQDHEPSAVNASTNFLVKSSTKPTVDVPRGAHHSNENRASHEATPKSSANSTSSGTIRPPLVRTQSAKVARTTYQRAAEALCQSLNVDGVVFLDASVGVFGGLADSLDTTGASSACESDDSASASYNSDAHSQESSQQDAKACPVLGAAQTLAREESASQPAAAKITESILRKLLQRYPSGKVWLYDEDGITYSENDHSTDATDDSHSSSLRSTETRERTRARSLRPRKEDSEIMQRAFPGARCIAIHGIYDHVRKRWTAGSIFWTYNPFRVLTLDLEMHFIQTFCDVIVAETRRLESVSSDKSKSDFISSISHELRSPLHGILGSAEMLTDLTLGATASTLVQQINACGTTLLEIIDHLLNFADLKKHKRHARGEPSNDRNAARKTPAFASPSFPRLFTNADVTLDTATEDAVVSAAYSFYYSKGNKNRGNVPVILDIDHLAATTWHCTLPIGGWKRVCLNLVTNALKYTNTGFIRVELKQKLRPGHRRRYDAVMTVSDSGIGMSRKFQKENLFRDFSQENTMSNGLGLGMNMVAKILNSMRGKIEVNSATGGSGTRVSVFVPLDSDRSSDGLAASADSISEAVSMFTECKGLAINLVADTSWSSTSSNDFVQDTATKMAIGSIEKKCKFLGAETRRCPWKTSASASLRIVAAVNEEACLQLMATELQTKARTRFPPTLVVCNSIPAAKAMRDQWAENPLNENAVIEYTALPCSMKQLVQAIESVLRSNENLQQSPTGGANGCSTPGHEIHVVDDDYPESPLTIRDLSNKQPVSAATPSVEDQNGIPTIAAPAKNTDSKGASVTETLTTSATAPQTQAQSSTISMASSISVRPKAPPRSLTITLPTPQSPTTASRVRHDSDPSLIDTIPSTAAPESKDPILLIVDDNLVNLQLLKMFAKKAGYPHTTSADGKLALDAFRSAHEASLLPPEPDNVGMPNIILMDINMPVMDGYESTQRIRHYENKHNLPPATIVAVSALQSEAAHVEAFGSGFNLFLSKPVKLKQLAKVIQEWKEGDASGD
jgi:signal transduction histidine kinase/CheY-like chemotaxis protein